MIDPRAGSVPDDGAGERGSRNLSALGPHPIETVVVSKTGRGFPPGTVLGAYRLLEEIGAGGMGRVFVAEHIRLGRKVALKVLRSEYSGNIEAVKRFFAEARAVNCINHENIIEVSDFIENPNGPSFYIMELLRGMELRALLDLEGVLPLPRALHIALQVCRGVGAAHEAGVIHRDLKPDNIFLIERDGRGDFVKLLDFGVAKLSNTTLDEASSFKTSAGIVVGTPDYMAPEQALGKGVDGRCDVYSLGVILFEMVAGRRPFVARTAREVMVQHMMAEPPRPSQLNPAYRIPVELEDLILACLRKDPDERPATIQDVERRLQLILDDFVMGRTSVGIRVGQGSHRGRGWMAAAGVALLLASGGYFAWSQGIRPDFPVALADAPGQALDKALRRTRGGATTPPAAPAALPAAASTENQLASTSRIERTTVEMIPERAAGPVSRAGNNAASTAEPAVAKTARPAAPTAAPARRKPVKLERDSVLNPFE